MRAIAILAAGIAAIGFAGPIVAADGAQIGYAGQQSRAIKALSDADITALRNGDGLMLDDGSIVRVAGKSELLVEITATSAAELARLAWHIGNRHTEMQIVGDKLRIRRDHVLEGMLHGLGAQLTSIEAPFDPEGGAYALASHEHGHGS